MMKTNKNGSLSGRRQQLLLVLFMSATVASAFVSPSVVQHSSMATSTIPTRGSGSKNVARTSRAWQLRVLIPGVDMAIMDAAIAVVSAAAGAASQLPRIQQLEKDLDMARSALTQTEQELVDKVSELEDQLFKMDQEFESQSGKIKKQFDQKLRDELERVRKKVKEEYQFTLDIKVQEERSKMLAEKLDFVGSVNGDKDIELVNLRLKQSQVQIANQELEEALASSKAELDRIQNLSNQKPWWQF